MTFDGHSNMKFENVLFHISPLADTRFLCFLFYHFSIKLIILTMNKNYKKSEENN